MLGHLMSKFLLLHCCMSGLHGTLGLHYLLLLHPCNMLCQCQILLLLPLIGIQIVILLRMIGDQKLCDGFMLEIAGHLGIQDSTLRPTLGYTVTYKTVDMFLTCGVFDEYLHVEKSY